MTLDDKEVHPSYDLGVWVKAAYFANGMNQMFDLAWKQK
jgi:hypothetical protein